MHSQVWDEIHYAWKKTCVHNLEKQKPMPNERNFFESMWRIDNIPGARKTEFTNTPTHRMVTNILLILMQVCGWDGVCAWWRGEWGGWGLRVVEGEWGSWGGGYCMR